jgi:ketosteroid isomerase-like protein
MKKTSWAILIVILMLILFLVYENASQNKDMSGEEQISSLIIDAKSAVEHKDLRRTMSYISDDYTGSDSMSRSQMQAYIIKAYRDSDRYSIAITKADIQVTGDTAKADLDVKIYSSYNHQNDEVFNGPVTILLKKEPARRWLIFPTSKWRVSGASGLPTLSME